MDILNSIFTREDIEKLTKESLQPSLNAYFISKRAPPSLLEENETQLSIIFIRTDENGKKDYPKPYYFTCYQNSDGQYEWVISGQEVAEGKKIPLSELNKEALTLLEKMLSDIENAYQCIRLDPHQPGQWLLSVDQQDEIQQDKLPYLPPNVSLDDIQSNGKLLPEEVIQAIHEMNLHSELNNRRLNKESLEAWGIQSPFGVIIMNNEIHAIYLGKDQDKQLGSGTHGTAKLAQNQDHDPPVWEALKIQESRKPLSTAFKETVEHELEVMKEINFANRKSQPIYHFSKKSHHQYNIIMPLATGINVSDLTSSAMNHQFSPVQWLQIGINIVKAIQALHVKGFLHCDIKGDNLKIDPITLNVTIIDLGAALPITSQKKSAAMTQPVGTPLYMAPEIFPEKTHYIYNEATETFAIGTLLAEVLFGFNLLEKDTHPEKKRNIMSYDNSQKFMEGYNRIPHERVRKALWNKLIVKMTDPNPSARPSLKEVEETLTAYQNQFPYIHARIATVGILDLDEYRHRTADEKNEMTKVLALLDKVWLIEKKGHTTPKTYLRWRRDLEERNIKVDGTIFRGHHPIQVISSISKIVQEENTLLFNQYFYVTAQPISPEATEILSKNNIAFITCDQNKTIKEYQTSIASALIPTTMREQDFKMTILFLETLQKKKSKTNKKYKLIEETKQILKEIYKTHQLTYAQLQEQLRTLQLKLEKTPISKTPQMLSKIGLHRPQGEGKTVDKVHEHLKETDVTTHHPKLK